MIIIPFIKPLEKLHKNVNENMFSFTFYSNFHASVTAIFVHIFMKFHKNVELRNWKFVCFVALRPKSTAMVIAGRSVHLTTLFPGQA